MPRYLCDYCDAYLTHDSATGRHQHSTGWKHRENFKQYYMQFYPQWAAEKQMQAMHAQMFAMPVGQPFAPGLMPQFQPPNYSGQLPQFQAPPQFQPPPQFQAPPPFQPPPQFPSTQEPQQQQQQYQSS